MTFSRKDFMPRDYSPLLAKLDLEVVSENIKENPKNYQLHVIVRAPRHMSMYALKESIQKIIPTEHISVSETIKQ